MSKEETQVIRSKGDHKKEFAKKLKNILAFSEKPIMFLEDCRTVNISPIV